MTGISEEKTGRVEELFDGGFTGVIAAAHFHICVIYTEDPSARVAHVGGPLDVYHISRAGAGDVEIALAIPGIETCLGGE